MTRDLCTARASFLELPFSMLLAVCVSPRSCIPTCQFDLLVNRIYVSTRQAMCGHRTHSATCLCKFTQSKNLPSSLPAFASALP